MIYPKLYPIYIMSYIHHKQYNLYIQQNKTNIMYHNQKQVTTTARKYLICY